MRKKSPPNTRPAEPIDARLLLLAYRHGVFPMADAREDADVFWVEPRDRAILPLDGLHLSRSLRKVIRQDRFRVTCDTAFERVIALCAAPRPDDSGSWISHRLEASYRSLRSLGHAHSIECWLCGELVGGLYGVAFDQVFCGESMFSRADDASKVALAWLVAGLRRAGYKVLDCQFMTGHLSSLGAVEIPQARYRALLHEARGQPRLSLPDAIGSFQAASAGSGAGAGALVGEGEAAGAGGVRRTGGRESRSEVLAPASSSSPVAGAAGSPGKRIVQSLTQTS